MKFFHGELILEVPESVYYPREDSLMLAKVLEKENLANKRVLEIGCGSGFLAIIMAKGNAKVTAMDISKDAVKATGQNANKNGVELTCLKSNLFFSVTGKFDLIVFNPPYLPGGDDVKYLKKERGHIFSSGSGRELIEKFISQAKAYLNSKGKILLLISSLTGEKEVLSLLHTNSFRTRIVAREKIPWEELIIIEAK